MNENISHYTKMHLIQTQTYLCNLSDKLLVYNNMINIALTFVTKTYFNLNTVYWTNVAQHYNNIILMYRGRNTHSPPSCTGPPGLHELWKHIINQTVSVEPWTTTRNRRMTSCYATATTNPPGGGGGEFNEISRICVIASCYEPRPRAGKARTACQR